MKRKISRPIVDDDLRKVIKIRASITGKSMKKASKDIADELMQDFLSLKDEKKKFNFKFI